MANPFKGVGRAGGRSQPVADLSALTADQLAEKVRQIITAGDYRLLDETLAELVRRASERDQAVREREVQQERYDALYADARYLRDDNHRLRDAIEKAITGCEGEIVGEALDELHAAWEHSPSD